MSLENMYPAFVDKIASARGAGYGDEDINTFLGGREADALKAGYSQQEVDGFLGRVPDASESVMGDVGRTLGIGLNNIAGAAGMGLEQIGMESAGRWMQDKTSSRAEELAGQLTYEQKQSNKKQWAHNEDGSVGFGEALTDPRSYMNTVVSSAPSMVVGMGAGGILTRAAAKVLGAGSTAAAAVGYGAGEGIVAGGMAGHGVVDEIRNTPYAQLVELEPFQQAYHSIDDAAMSHDDKLALARSKMETAAYFETVGKVSLVTGILSAPTGVAFDKMLRGVGLGTKAAKPKLSDVPKYATGEALQEMPQEGSETYLTDSVRSEYIDTSIDPSANVLEAAVAGGLAGGVMGGGSGAGAYVVGASNHGKTMNRITELEKQMFDGQGVEKKDVDPAVAQEYLGLVESAKENWDEESKTKPAVIVGGGESPNVEAEVVPDFDEVVQHDIEQAEALPTNNEYESVLEPLPQELTTPPAVDEDLAVGERAAELAAVETPLQETVTRVANTAATSPENGLPEPTPKQQEAGNYKKGHVKIHGLDIAIENPRGSERKGVDPDGDAWAVTMPAHYGYVKRTEGADGDHVDVYIGESPESENVFVVDQLDIATGSFDEHKVVLGVDNVEEATKLYVGGFSDGKGQERIGAIAEMPIDEFKGWLRDGDQRRPIANHFADGNNVVDDANDLESELSEPIGKVTPVNFTHEFPSVSETGETLQIDSEVEPFGSSEKLTTRQPTKKTASWVIKDKATGDVVMETFDQGKVDALNTDKYEAVPIMEHLQQFNAEVADVAVDIPVAPEPKSSKSLSGERVELNELPLRKVEDGIAYFEEQLKAVTDEPIREQVVMGLELLHRRRDELAPARPEAAEVALLSLSGRDLDELGRPAGDVVGVDMGTLRSIVGRFKKKFRDVEIIPVETFSSLPPAVQEDVRKQYGSKADPKGVEHGGSVYVIADANSSVAEVEETILHEVEGHVGIHRLFGEKITGELNKLFTDIGGYDGLIALAKKRDQVGYIKDYALLVDNFDKSDEVKIQFIMDELLAIHAESPKFADRVKAIIGAIRQWLREHGFATLAEYGETDLLHILAQGRRTLNRDDNVKFSAGGGSILVGESGLGDVQVSPTRSLPFIRTILDKERLEQVLVKGGNVDAVRQVAKSFGKTVVFFREQGRDNPGLLRPEGGSGDSKAARNNGAQENVDGVRGSERAGRIGGFVYPSQPNKLFLNVDSPSHILFTLGHELGHTLRMDDEQLWKQMAAELKPLIRKWSEYQGKLDDPRYAELSELEQTEELFGDLIGHNFLNELFWQDIAELNPTLFKKLARRAIALLNKALRVLTGHNVSRFVSDVEQARAILAKTLLDYGKNVAAGKYAEYAEQYDASYVGERVDGPAILQRLKDAGVSEDMLTKAFAGMRLSVDGKESLAVRHSVQVAPVAVDRRVRRLKKAYQDAKPRVQHTIDYLRMKLQDKYLPLQRVQDSLESSGWIKTEANDARLAEELYHSKVTLRLEEFYEDVVQPLVDAVKDSDVTIAELEDYLYAKFAPQRNAYIAKINPKMPDAGSGMSNEEARAILERFEKDEKIDVLKSLEMEVRDVTQMQRDIIRASGLELDDTMDAWEFQNPFYIPLKGGKDDSKRKTIGVGANISRSGTQQALGRDTRATDVLAHLFEQVGKTIERSERAKIGRAFLKMVKENPDAGMWKVFDPKKPETMPKKRKLVKNLAVSGLGKERAKLAARIVDGGLPMAWKQRMQYRIEEINNQIAFAGTETVQSVVDYSYLQNENILSVTKENGDMVYIEIEDADLSRVMQGQEVSMNKALQVAGSVTRFLSQMNTMFNPEFLITNFERDVQTALIHVSGEHSGSAAKKVAKSIFPAMKGIHNATRGDNSSDWADWYHRYRKAGGQISFMDLQGAEHWQRKLKNMSGEGGVMDLTRANIDRLGNFIGDYNTIVENATRLASFKVGIEGGMSEAEAASVARNLTVNFNKKGELGPAINALYMFANAGVQGSARIFGAMKHKRVQKIAGAGVMLGVALAEMGRLVGGDDEDDENRWDKVSEFTKQTNMVFTMPDGDIVKIRMPYGYNVFVATGYAISDFVHGKSLYDTVKFMTSSVMNAFNPLGGDEGLLKVLSPTFTDPLIEIATNENFMGSNIRPDNFAFGAKKPDSQLYFRSVSTPSKAVTRFLNSVTGGSKYEPGAIDISPETLDHLFSFIVGGTGRTVGRVVDMPIKAAQGDLLLKDVPYLRQMYETQSEYVNSSRFYENTERVATLRATLKELPLSERSVFFRAHPEVKMFKLAGKVARRIAAYRKRYYHYIDSGDKQKAAAVKKRMEALFLRFNKSFNSVSA